MPDIVPTDCSVGIFCFWLLDLITPTPEHRKTAINGLAPSGGFHLECSIMMNDLEIFVKPPLTAE